MIFILLPVHNRKEVTEKFIKCLIYQSVQDYKLILIDDGSSDKTDKMVLSYLPDSEIIYGDGNLWWSGALQKGYDWLKTYSINNDDSVLIINDDTIIESDFLKKGLFLLKNSKKTLFLAKCYSLNTGEVKDEGVNVNWNTLKIQQAELPENINCFSTRGLFLKAQDFVDLGGFHPKLLPHYFSDYEFTMRAKRMNYELKCESYFYLKLDEETTGLRNISFQQPFIKFIKCYFSIRNPTNPIYKISFILLASTWQWKLINIFRVIISTVLILARVGKYNLRTYYENF